MSGDLIILGVASRLVTVQTAIYQCGESPSKCDVRHARKLRNLIANKKVIPPPFPKAAALSGTMCRAHVYPCKTRMRGGWSVFLPHSPLGSLIWRSSVEHRARQGWKMSLNGSTARPDRVVYLKSRVVSCRRGRISRSWLHVCQDRSVVGSPAWQITPTGFQATCTRHMKSSVMLKDLHYDLWSHALRRCDGTSLTYWEEGFSTRPYISLTMYWSPQLHSFCMLAHEVQGVLRIWTECSWEASLFC